MDQKGAVYQKHWAFIPLKEIPVPNTKDRWASNEIDHFILQKLDDIGMEPSDVKYDATLLKRMMHDITGLPPTLSQQDEFAKSLTQNLTKSYWIRLWKVHNTGRRWRYSGWMWLGMQIVTAIRMMVCVRCGLGVIG